MIESSQDKDALLSLDHLRADNGTPRQKGENGTGNAEPYALHPKNDVESPESDSDEWQSFLADLYSYGNGKYKEKQRRTYEIDIDIAETLKGFQVSGVTRSDVINAILRSFIVRHKDDFLPLIKRPQLLF